MKVQPMHPVLDTPAAGAPRAPMGAQQAQFERLLEAAPRTPKATTKGVAEPKVDARSPGHPVLQPKQAPAAGKPDDRGHEAQLPAKPGLSERKAAHTTETGTREHKAAQTTGPDTREHKAAPTTRPDTREHKAAPTTGPDTREHKAAPTTGPDTRERKAAPTTEPGAHKRKVQGGSHEQTLEDEKKHAGDSPPPARHPPAPEQMTVMPGTSPMTGQAPAPTIQTSTSPKSLRDASARKPIAQGPVPTAEANGTTSITVTGPLEANRTSVSDKSPAHHHEQEQSSPPPALPLAMLPGDRVLQSMAVQASAPAFVHDLQALVERLQLQLLAGKRGNGDMAMLRAQLPHLGTVEVRLIQAGHALQVEIHASPGSLQQLQAARGELLERLQRLDPGQPLSLSFANDSSGDQRSRNQRHVHDEWQPEQ